MVIHFGEYSSKGLSVIEGQNKHDYRGKNGYCDLVNSTFDLPSRKTIHIISGQGYN